MEIKDMGARPFTDRDDDDEEVEDLVLYKEPTTLQRRFIEKYCGTANFVGVEAAEQAGYQGTRKQLRKVAYRNMQKPHIKHAIEQRLDELAMSDREATKRLGDMARANIGDFFKRVEVEQEEGGATTALVVDEEAVLEEGGGIIQQIDAAKGKLQVYDAKDALKTILDAHGAFNHKRKVDMTTGGERITEINLNVIHTSAEEFENERRNGEDA